MALNATSFVNLIFALDLADELLGVDSHLTLFLPSNKAFMRLSDDVKRRLKDDCFLKKLLRYHFAKGHRTLSSLKDGDKVNTLINESIAIRQNGKVCSCFIKKRLVLCIEKLLFLAKFGRSKIFRKSF